MSKKKNSRRNLKVIDIDIKFKEDSIPQPA